MSKVTIANYSGGQAPSKYKGGQGSYAYGQNLDIHTQPGLLQAGQALAKNSGATVTGLILWQIIDADGTYYGGDDNGKIWKRTTGGVWSEEVDLSARICGLIYFDGFYYAATSDTLYKGATIAALASSQTWTGEYIDTEWHPMHIADDKNLYIGAGKFLSKIEHTSGTYTADALDLPSGWRVRSLTSHDVGFAIGAWKGTSKNEGRVFPWDGLATSFFTPVELVGSCNAMLNVNGVTIVQAGNKGELFYISAGRAVPVVQIPGNYTDTDKADTNPDALEKFGNLIMTGVSEFTVGDDSTKEGVWSFGSKDFNYPQVPNYEYVISEGGTSGVNVGSILKVGEDLFVSWEEGGVYGVDLIDYNVKYDGATYESVLLWDGHPEKVVKEIDLAFDPLPASCAITCMYKTEPDGSWIAFTDPTTGIANTAGDTELNIIQSIPNNLFEIQAVLTTNGNDTPKIHSIQHDVRSKFARK